MRPYTPEAEYMMRWKEKLKAVKTKRTSLKNSLLTLLEFPSSDDTDDLANNHHKTKERYDIFKKRRETLLSDEHKQGWSWSPRFSALRSWFWRVLSLLPFSWAKKERRFGSRLREELEHDLPPIELQPINLDTTSDIRLDDEAFETALFENQQLAIKELDDRIKILTQDSNPTEIHQAIERLNATKLRLSYKRYQDYLTRLFEVAPKETLRFYYNQYRLRHAPPTEAHSFIEHHLMAQCLLDFFILRPLPIDHKENLSQILYNMQDLALLLNAATIPSVVATHEPIEALLDSGLENPRVAIDEICHRAYKPIQPFFDAGKPFPANRGMVWKTDVGTYESIDITSLDLKNPEISARIYYRKANPPIEELLLTTLKPDSPLSLSLDMLRSLHAKAREVGLRVDPLFIHFIRLACEALMHSYSTRTGIKDKKDRDYDFEMAWESTHPAYETLNYFADILNDFKPVTIDHKQLANWEFLNPYERSYHNQDYFLSQYKRPEKFAAELISAADYSNAIPTALKLCKTLLNCPLSPYELDWILARVNHRYPHIVERLEYLLITTPRNPDELLADIEHALSQIRLSQENTPIAYKHALKCYYQLVYGCTLTLTQAHQALNILPQLKTCINDDDLYKDCEDRLTSLATLTEKQREADDNSPSVRFSFRQAHNTTLFKRRPRYDSDIRLPLDPAHAVDSSGPSIL